MLENIQTWTSGIIESQLNSPLFFIAIFLLGLLAAVGSCCNIGVIAAVTTYAGLEAQQEKISAHLKTSFSFFLGNVIALSLLGALTGLVSESLGSAIGKYWSIVAGLLMVYLGLTSLEMLPFELKLGDKLTAKVSNLANKGFVFGLALGGLATTCSASCSPIFPIVLGTSFLQGSLFMSWLTLFVFAIGYSLPLGGVLAGAGFGLNKFSDHLVKNKQLFSNFFAVFLVLVGFVLLLGWL